MSYHIDSVDHDQRAEYFAERRDQETRPGSRKLLATAVALLVMGLFAGGLWFAYVQGMRHASSAGGGGDVPLIRADERPTKVKPDKPGGMEIPDRDKLIYTQKRVAVEHLLPPGHQSLGIHLDVSHTAATPVGLRVTATAEVIRVEGRTITFNVAARDEFEQIGGGTHQRVVVSVERFDERVQRKVRGER